MKEVELELAEAKDTVEFVQSEHSVQVEELQEVEAALATERSKHAEAVVELETARGQVEEKDTMLQQLAAKFARNRQVWLENERKANDEIQKLDSLIDNVIVVLTAGGDAVQRIPTLKRLLDELDGRVAIKPDVIKANGQANGQACETKLN